MELFGLGKLIKMVKNATETNGFGQYKKFKKLKKHVDLVIDEKNSGSAI